MLMNSLLSKEASEIRNPSRQTTFIFIIPLRKGKRFFTKICSFLRIVLTSPDSNFNVVLSPRNLHYFLSAWARSRPVRIWFSAVLHLIMRDLLLIFPSSPQSLCLLQPFHDLISYLTCFNTRHPLWWLETEQLSRRSPPVTHLAGDVVFKNNY